jgi:hypothetical protein
MINGDIPDSRLLEEVDYDYLVQEEEEYYYDEGFLEEWNEQKEKSKENE